MDGLYVWDIGRVKYGIHILPRNRRRFWWEWWKPRYHDGRGSYITIGLWFLAFYRGY